MQHNHPDLPRPRARGRLIAIEGPTGAGKTTLAKKLAPPLNAEPALDPFEENTYLLRLLGGQSSQATRLACELSFIALRTAALREAEQRLEAGHNVITDWAWFKGPVFAKTTLSRTDADRIAHTCRLWETNLPVPDLVIILTAPTNVLRARIRRRSRPGEAAINNVELSFLNDALDRAAIDSGRPLLRIDTDQFNAFDTAHLQQLTDRINEHIGFDRSTPHAPSRTTTIEGHTAR